MFVDDTDAGDIFCFIYLLSSESEASFLFENKHFHFFPDLADSLCICAQWHEQIKLYFSWEPKSEDPQEARCNQTTAYGASICEDSSENDSINWRGLFEFKNLKDSNIEEIRTNC